MTVLLSPEGPGEYEGWARYAEGLGEELGIYDDKDAAIMRRIWPARGMVVDPGLSIGRANRRSIASSALDSTPLKSADDLVDRIAVMPGQLAAYGSGGLEIADLLRQAQAALGSRFDLKAFDRTVLEVGVVPLGELRTYVEDWIARTRDRSPALSRRSGADATGAP